MAILIFPAVMTFHLQLRAARAMIVDLLRRMDDEMMPHTVAKGGSSSFAIESADHIGQVGFVVTMPAEGRSPPIVRHGKQKGSPV